MTDESEGKFKNEIFQNHGIQVVGYSKSVDRARVILDALDGIEDPAAYLEELKRNQRSFESIAHEKWLDSK